MIPQPLVHDLLKMKKNRVRCRVDDDTSGVVKSEIKTYDLENSDPFWRRNCSTTFHEVAEDIQRCVAEYQREKEAVWAVYFIFLH